MTTARMQRNEGQPGDYPPLLLNYQIFTTAAPADQPGVGSGHRNDQHRRVENGTFQQCVLRHH